MRLKQLRFQGKIYQVLPYLILLLLFFFIFILWKYIWSGLWWHVQIILALWRLRKKGHNCCLGFEDLYVWLLCLCVCMCIIYMPCGHENQESLRFPVTEEKFDLVLHCSDTLSKWANCHPVSVDRLSQSFTWEEQILKAASCTKVSVWLLGHNGLFFFFLYGFIELA